MEKKIGYLLTQSFFEVFEEKGSLAERERRNKGTFEKKFKPHKERIYPLEETFSFALFPIFFVDESEKPVISPTVPPLHCRLFD